jgi:protein TonB
VSAATPPSRIRIAGAVQNANLLKQVAPVLPESTIQAGISGTVAMQVIIAKDGTVQNIQLLSGHPLLVGPAIEAVRQWLYRPTLLNGEPVEVTTTINVTFGNPQ